MTRTIEQIEAELAKPLNMSEVQKRKGAGGKDLSYVSAEFVKRQMNAAFGPLGWSCRTTRLEILRQGEYQTKDGPKFGCVFMSEVEVEVHAGHVRMTGVGFGNGSCRLEDDGMAAYELAGKEAESDALKRAVNRLGDRFGAALYDKTQARVVDDVLEASVAGARAALELAKTKDEVRELWGSWDGKTRNAMSDAVRQRNKELA